MFVRHYSGVANASTLIRKKRRLKKCGLTLRRRGWSEPTGDMATSRETDNAGRWLDSVDVCLNHVAPRYTVLTGLYCQVFFQQVACAQLRRVLFLGRKTTLRVIRHDILLTKVSQPLAPVEPPYRNSIASLVAKAAAGTDVRLSTVAATWFCKILFCDLLGDGLFGLMAGACGQLCRWLPIPMLLYLWQSDLLIKYNV
jgi:hypothetical protein